MGPVRKRSKRSRREDQQSLTLKDRSLVDQRGLDSFCAKAYQLHLQACFVNVVP